jgi:hypothetical protein
MTIVINDASYRPGQLSFLNEKLYAHVVGGFYESDASGRVEVPGFNRKNDSLFLELVTKTIEIPLYLETIVIRAPMHTLFSARLLTRSLTTDHHDGTLEGYKNLRGATYFIAADDFAAQFVHIPGCSGLRVLTDVVDMVKNDAGIRHNNFPLLRNGVLLFFTL